MNNILAFKKLPADVRQRLIELQVPAADNFVFVPPLSKMYWLAIGAMIGWCAYLFVSTQNYLWEGWMYWLFFAGSLIFVSLGLYAIFRLIRARTTSLRDGCVFTTDECIRTNGGRVEFWNLRELEGFQFREDIRTIEIWIGDKVKKIRADNIADAERLGANFTEIRKNAGEGFLPPYAKPENAYQSSADWLLWGGLVVVFIAAAFGATSAAQLLNRRFDDEQTWKRTQEATSVGDFEEYKKRHPQGIYAAEADRRMAEIFGKLKENYAAKIKKTADETAVKGLSEFLDALGKLPDRTVYVKVSEKRELDDEVIRKMKLATGYSISGYDYSMPGNNEDYRKDKLTKDLGLVFLPATRSASVNFELTDNPPPDRAVLNVAYVAKSVENFYRYDWYSNRSITTFYYPALQFDFDLTLNGADGRELYRTKYGKLLQSPGSTGLIDARDVANYSFDKLYFASVSDDFCKYLGRQFGFLE